MGQHKKVGHWCLSWNSELYNLYNEPNIVEDIKIRRLGWAGHIIRMEEERIPKKVLNRNFYTTRPVGRPRTRWTDVVQRDALQLLGIRGCMFLVSQHPSSSSCTSRLVLY